MSQRDYVWVKGKSVHEDRNKLLVQNTKGKSYKTLESTRGDDLTTKGDEGQSKDCRLVSSGLK